MYLDLPSPPRLLSRTRIIRRRAHSGTTAIENDKLRVLPGLYPDAAVEARYVYGEMMDPIVPMPGTIAPVSARTLLYFAFAITHAMSSGP